MSIKVTQRNKIMTIQTNKHMNNNNLLISAIIIYLMVILSSCKKEEDHSGLPVDGDGNEYDTIVIGTQTWLKENLKTTTYRFGNPVRLITDNTEWTTWQQPAYCWYDNNPDNKDVYGALYNWFAVKTQALCPDGWHVPTLIEWNTLIYFCGGEYEAGCRLKETGTFHWEWPNSCATNESGFTALPGGNRYFGDGSFNKLNEIGEFWISDYCDKIGVASGWGQTKILSWYKTEGLSVRCIKNK
jgi:uncharacterized protein (TIGR02145 family)